MKTYVIQLDTVQNLKDYLYMLETFSFSGIVKSGSSFIEPEDIPLVGFACVPILLMIDTKDSTELERLDIYLNKQDFLYHK